MTFLFILPEFSCFEMTVAKDEGNHHWSLNREASGIFAKWGICIRTSMEIMDFICKLQLHYRRCESMTVRQKEISVGNLGTITVRIFYRENMFAY